MDAPLNTTELLLKTHTSTDGSVSPRPRWCKGLPPTKFDVTFDDDKSDTNGNVNRHHDEQNKPQQEQEPATPNTTASTSDDDDDEEAHPSPPSLRPCGARDVSTTSTTSTTSGCRRGKAYMAWRWLIEDEGASEAMLHKADEDNPVVLPKLLDSERELLCRNVELRSSGYQRLVATLRTSRRWSTSTCASCFFGSGSRGC
eukprot:g3228.t1